MVTAYITLGSNGLAYINVLIAEKLPSVPALDPGDYDVATGDAWLVPAQDADGGRFPERVGVLGGAGAELSCEHAYGGGGLWREGAGRGIRDSADDQRRYW